MQKKICEDEVISVRVIGAPREKVFEAFSHRERLERWWGPKGFVNEFHVFEFHEGGAWRFEMRGPDGRVYEMEKRFVEVKWGEKIVVEHVQEGHRFWMTMSFAEVGEKTRVTWRMEFEEKQGEEILQFIARANEENFDRLEEELGSPLLDRG